MFLLYDLLITLATLLLFPYYQLKRSFGGKARLGLRERLAIYPAQRFTALTDRPTIWVHAVSVGETRAAIPLLRALRQAWPDHALLLSHVTETGRAVAESIKDVDACLFFPVDHSWVMRRAFARIRPVQVVIVETEIWPNFVRVAAQNNIPVALVNGRISDRSYPRYLRLRHWLRSVLDCISVFAMQSQEDARRIVAIGARPERVEVVGNLKFDLPASLVPAAPSSELRVDYRLPIDLPVWVAGSTHAGEEDAILETFQKVLTCGLKLILVLVPRHPERSSGVSELLTRQAIPYRRRSTLSGNTPLLRSGEVLLVDTLGEMLRLYAAADVVFVGGSLVPVGGHNLLEAALVKRMVLFGPYMHNFRDIAQLVLLSGAGRQVKTETELAEAVAAALSNPATTKAAGEIGYALLGQHAGATDRIVRLIEQNLGGGQG